MHEHMVAEPCTRGMGMKYCRHMREATKMLGEGGVIFYGLKTF